MCVCGAVSGCKSVLRRSTPVFFEILSDLARAANLDDFAVEVRLALGDDHLLIDCPLATIRQNQRLALH